MAAGNAHIGKPAPDFTAKAVMPDGQFQDLSLSDYKGMTLMWRRRAVNKQTDCNMEDMKNI